MPVRPLAFAGARDVLFVVVSTVMAFFGVAMAAVGDDSPAVPAAISPIVSRSIDARPERPERQRAWAAFRTTASLNPFAKAAATARIDPGQAGEPAPRDRFAGEGPVRKGAIAERDPYDRRAYILETASLMHRRGWIGLSAERTAAPAGEDVPSDPD